MGQSEVCETDGGVVCGRMHGCDQEVGGPEVTVYDGEGVDVMEG